MNWNDCLPVAISNISFSNDEIVLYCKVWRNQQLALSDWTQLPDVDIANKWDWAVYRQQLRDLPGQGDNPKLWIFPVPPT